MYRITISICAPWSPAPEAELFGADIAIAFVTEEGSAGPGDPGLTARGAPSGVNWMRNGCCIHN